MRSMLLIVSLLFTTTYCFAQGAQHMGTPQEQKACSETPRAFAESSWVMTWPYNNAFSSIGRSLAGNVRKSFKATEFEISTS